MMPRDPIWDGSRQRQALGGIPRVSPQPRPCPGLLWCYCRSYQGRTEGAAYIPQGWVGEESALIGNFFQFGVHRQSDPCGHGRPGGEGGFQSDSVAIQLVCKTSRCWGPRLSATGPSHLPRHTDISSRRTEESHLAAHFVKVSQG